MSHVPDREGEQSMNGVLIRVLKRCVIVPLFLTVLYMGTAAAEDIPDSADHPIISRYPGSVIQWYTVDNYREYLVPVGPVSGYRQIEELIETEGRVTRIYYTLDNSPRSESEVLKNYREALLEAGFEILADGFEPAGSRSVGVGSRKWREVLFMSNPWEGHGPVSEMTRGSATSGGGGSVVARKLRAAGTAYVIATVYRFSEDRIGAMVDVIEVEEAETGLIVVDAEAIGAGIEEHGRVVLDGIYFDFDKATLKPESKAALDQIAIFLRAQPGMDFYVVGHTDASGAFSYNQNLSAARARAVVEALVKDAGIQSDRLEPHGVGPLAPVFSNSSDAGSDKNRRVELVER